MLFMLWALGFSWYLKGVIKGQFIWWFIYVTNWTHLLLTITCIVRFISTAMILPTDVLGIFYFEVFIEMIESFSMCR